MLSKALALADELHGLLRGEVERARAEREVLRSLDPDQIFTRAAERAAFNDQVARLQHRLAEALREGAAALGVAEVTVSGIARRDPLAAARLSRTLAEVRALGHTLSRLDTLNRTLAGRALACVQGYLSALRPMPAAYDRRGARAVAPVQAAFSSKA
jgi:hypothetical protein